MTVRARVAKLEAVRPGAAMTFPHEQACRIKAAFYDRYFPDFWRRGWRDAFAARLRRGQLQADDRLLIAGIPESFRGLTDFHRTLLDAIEGAETLPGLWRD